MSIFAGSLTTPSFVQINTRLATWRDTGVFSWHHGHRIFWREGGVAGAPVLLLIHGFPTASWDWEAMWPELASRYRLLTLDMIGFGFSDKPTDYDYSILDQADICEALLRERGVDAYHVLAHDYGDSVAQELLARSGERDDRLKLESVCFLNGGLFPETHRPVLIQKLLLSRVGPLVAKLPNKTAVARNMRRIFGQQTQPDAALIDAFWALMTANDGLKVFPQLIGYMPERRLRRARWVGALQATSVPLKLIDGSHDPVSGTHMVQRYRELVAHPDITELPGIGHYPQVEAPHEVLAAYLGFRALLTA
jgi:pimeloyl-ACP methyl ester carboxylesterase